MVTEIAEVDALGDDGKYRLRSIFNLQTRMSEDHGKSVQLTWTGERSAMAGHLRPEEQALVTDLIRPILEPADARREIEAR